MADKPVILTIDDDPQVLGAVARDLRRRYGEDYRIVRADSGATALEAVLGLKQRGTPIALLLADQRMPRMDGVAFLGEAMAHVPDAQRALLTAYADTDAAISAINQSRIHYYLLKPWDPPEEKLYPVLDDLLSVWQAGYRPPFSGIRLVGDRWSALGHTLRDFLARNQVPYRWLDVEDDEEGSAIVDREGLSAEQLPMVILEDGEKLERPTTLELAQRAGLKTKADSDFYDLIIVGAGPAGLASGVYGASEGLKVALLDSEAPGGQAGTSSRIENYLGFPSGLSGGDLARRGVSQARRFGVELISPQSVTGIDRKENYKVVTLTNGSRIGSHALVVATGVQYGKLSVPGSDELTGSGVYYGSSIAEVVACTAKDVYIVGAGNSAGQAALNLAGFARSVTLLVRGGRLETKMSQYLVERIREAESIHVALNTRVTGVRGNGHLEAITLESEGREVERETSALFIFIGASRRWCMNPAA